MVTLYFGPLGNDMFSFQGHDAVATGFSVEQLWFIRQRQIWAMNLKWPEFEIASVKDMLGIKYPELFIQKTVWIGPLQPSDLSRVYLVEVNFAPVTTEYPFVKIIDPEIPHHKDIHMFSGQGNLCLFDSRIPLCTSESPRKAYSDWVRTGIWPGNPEWNIMSLIADTTIPWVAEWLLQYEAWKITGEWLGGGHVFDDMHITPSVRLRLYAERLNKSIKKKSRLLRRIKNAA
jgi:hypothetical protein